MPIAFDASLHESLMNLRLSQNLSDAMHISSTPGFIAVSARIHPKTLPFVALRTHLQTINLARAHPVHQAQPPRISTR